MHWARSRTHKALLNFHVNERTNVPHPLPWPDLSLTRFRLICTPFNTIQHQQQRVWTKVRPSCCCLFAFSCAILLRAIDDGRWSEWNLQWNVNGSGGTGPLAAATLCLGTTTLDTGAIGKSYCTLVGPEWRVCVASKRASNSFLESSAPSLACLCVLDCQGSSST